MHRTAIEWTQWTWNPETGCSPVSPGCRHCYAERFACRLRGRCGYPADDPFRVTLHPDRLNQPASHRQPSVIFVCSMGDLFHSEVPTYFVDRVFEAMEACPQHRFIILSKRVVRMRDYCEVRWFGSNVILGVSTENQAAADERIPHLLQMPGACHAVSVEPMLGPVDLREYLPGNALISAALHHKRTGHRLTGQGHETDCRDCPSAWRPQPRVLEWVICGGESGPGARPMHPSWVSSLRDQCAATKVPFFFKSWGAWSPASTGQVPPPKSPARRLSYLGADVSDLPGLWDETDAMMAPRRLGRPRSHHVAPGYTTAAGVAQLDGLTYREVPAILSKLDPQRPSNALLTGHLTRRDSAP